MLCPTHAGIRTAIVQVSTCLAFVVCPVSSALAIDSFLAEYTSLSQEIDGVEAAVLADLTAVTDGAANAKRVAQFTVVEVLKPTQGIKKGSAITVQLRVGVVGDQFLLYREKKASGWTWGRTAIISPTGREYLKSLPALSAAQSTRDAFFVKHLGATDRVIADDVYTELARIEFARIRKLQDQIPLKRLRIRIRDDKTDSRIRGFYGLLIGLCGDSSDLELLRSIVRKVEPTNGGQLGMEAAIAGYLLLAGEPGLKLIESNRLTNTDAPFFEFYAGLQAIQFLWTNGNGRISKERLRQSLRLVLDMPEVVHRAIDNLARWEDWSQQDRILSLYKQHSKTYVGGSIKKYLRASLKASPESHVINSDRQARVLAFLERVQTSPNKLTDPADHGHADSAKARERLKQLEAVVFERKGYVVEVNANRTQIQDADLARVSVFERLTDLSLEQTQISDAGIVRLTGMPRLEWLNLYRTNVGDVGLKHLSQFKNLKLLPIGETRVTDAGLKSVSSMTQLKYLGLRANDVSDTGLSFLRVLINLEGLHLGETKVTDAGLTHLSACTQLKKLWLDDTAITDAAVPQLVKFKKLQLLHVAGTKLSSDGILRLRQGLPNCEVIATRRK